MIDNINETKPDYAKILLVRPFIEQIYAHKSVGNQIAIIIISDKFSDVQYNQEIIKSISSSIKCYDFENFHLSITNIRKIISIVKATGSNVILVNGLNDILAIRTALFMIRGINRPMIVGMSHNPNTWKTKIKSIFAICLIKYFTDGFITLSSSHLEKLIKSGIAASRISRIPNAFSPIVEYKDNYAQSYNNQLVYVANIEPRKGQHILLEALHVIKRTNIDFVCSFIGRVNDDQYKTLLDKLISDYGLGDNIVFTGWLDHNCVFEKISNCTVFVFPSYNEMMPRAVIEAMWYGKPVIASKVDGIIDLIEDKYSGLLVEPGNINQLADAIIKLLQNPHIAEKYALNGKNFVQENCSYEQVGNLYNSFFDKLLKNKYNC